MQINLLPQKGKDFVSQKQLKKAFNKNETFLIENNLNPVTKDKLRRNGVQRVVVKFAGQRKVAIFDIR